MCKRRIRKIKKGSEITRLREARRIQRLHRMSSQSTSDESNHRTQAEINKDAQNRVILELAWKTVLLMQKNRLIQQKIIALKKETSEFVENVMKNPENQRRYKEHIRLHGTPEAQSKTRDNIILQLKLEHTA